MPTQSISANTARLPRPRWGASAPLLDDGTVLLAGGDKALGGQSAPSCPEADPQVLRYWDPVGERRRLTTLSTVVG